MILEHQLSEVWIPPTTWFQIQMTACLCSSEFDFYFLLYSKIQLFVPEVVILQQVGIQLFATWRLTLLRPACSCLPAVFHLMPAKHFDYSTGYCHCSATRVGREEEGECPAHCQEVKSSLGRTLNKLFASDGFFFPTVCCSTIRKFGYGMGKITP